IRQFEAVSKPSYLKKEVECTSIILTIIVVKSSARRRHPNRLLKKEMDLDELHQPSRRDDKILCAGASKTDMMCRRRIRRWALKTFSAAC
ncbi:hypothetical protein, partial [Jannaschia seosinensis]|uniref:hypothetical protein n=1 Tax=Jannaschia seosinensis TaxID=313367 RepID=UPI001C90D2E7